MPSKPRMTSFWENFDGGLRVAPEHASTDNVAAAVAAARNLPDLLMRMNGIITSARAVHRSRRSARAEAAAVVAGLHAVRGRVAPRGHRRVDGCLFRRADTALVAALDRGPGAHGRLGRCRASGGDCLMA